MFFNFIALKKPNIYVSSRYILYKIIDNISMKNSSAVLLLFSLSSLLIFGVQNRIYL